MTDTTLDDYFAGSLLLEVWEERLPPLPEGRRHLYGPTLAVWLKERHPHLKARLPDDLYRNVKAWKAGRIAGEETVEQVLHLLGSDLIELPREFWIDKPKRQPQTTTLGPRTLEALENKPVAA